MRTRLRDHAPTLTVIDGDGDRTGPPRLVLCRRLLRAQQRWRSSHGRERDEAMAEMLRLSKAIDEA